jgi:hypothetical protein
MDKPTIRLAAVTVGAVVLGTLVSGMTTLAARHQTVAEQDLISGPENWVPLTYQWEDRVNGATLYWYVEHRAADGSTRRDRSDGRETLIMHLPSKKYFILDNAGWTQHPMREQMFGGVPFTKLKRSSVTRVRRTDPRVRLATDLGIGASFYEMPLRIAGGQGVVVGQQVGSIIFCPELNMLEVWERRTRMDGLVEKILTSISLGEPPVLWGPPLR